MARGTLGIFQMVRISLILGIRTVGISGLYFRVRRRRVFVYVSEVGSNALLKGRVSSSSESVFIEKQVTDASRGELGVKL